MAAKSSAKKKKSAPAKPLRERAVVAALDLAARMPWDMVTLTDIADKAHASLAELCEVFEDKTDILAAYGRMVDKQVLENVGAADPSVSERDRLFEILMERFDVMEEHKDALASILKSLTVDPKQAVIGLPHLGRSMNWMFEAAGLSASGIKGAIKIAGLTALYLYVLKVWLRDETADLSKTMAALDKSLGRAERAVNSFML
ncbi:MAG: TetR family transcriptional regulator [Micavibrio aeruginosavorus]|uniref:TetR family transcriptional regulator n=1 Tax=Micavibrio aeruginosavorus TaxID=349221 RepID=A0A2W5MX86_9BACT|nr:MAG: TetR family transcriptional regulator [Micavibrio aeruginosavorus]